MCYSWYSPSSPLTGSHSCHPFYMGRYMFMHNGMIGDFHKVRRKLLTKLGRRAFDFAVSKVLHHPLAINFAMAVWCYCLYRVPCVLW